MTQNPWEVSLSIATNFEQEMHRLLDFAAGRNDLPSTEVATWATDLVIIIAGLKRHSESCRPANPPCPAATPVAGGVPTVRKRDDLLDGELL